MKPPRICEECGVEMPTHAPEGLCPNCLLQVGASALALQAREDRGRKTEDDAGKTRNRIRDYELLEKIGQGGMGVVYKARQRSLDRMVALKLLPFGAFSADDTVQRFRAEASAAAGLNHPNIVAIHEVGEHERQPYFSMDYVEGQTLAEVVRERPLTAKRAATYLKTIAEAVHYAHQHGILHRDLKPSNILIDTFDQPRITDFGLAKRLTVDSDMTLTGQVLGSPNFMSPEQAEGRQKEVGPASDVYALGGLLYHLLTRRPPFQGDTLTTLLKQVIEAEPVPPRLLNPSVPRDLETICLKCLEKDVARRYPTAQELAKELGRFLEDKPIQARPVGALGKAWKWCQRRPALAGTLAALFVTFLFGLTGVLWQSRQAKNERRMAQMGEYAADMFSAQLALADNNRALAVSLLDKHRPEGKSEVRGPKSETDLRGWEWRYLWQRCQGDELFRLYRYPDSIGAVAVSKNGRLLAVQTAGNKAALWDWKMRRPIAELADAGLTALAFSPDDGLLAVAGRNARGEPTVDLWDVHAQKVGSTLNHTAPVRSLAFSPDGKLLATFDEKGTMEVVEWRSNRVLTHFTSPTPRRSEAGLVTFSPDGNRLAVGEDFGTIRLLKWPSGSAVPIQTQTGDGVTALAFSPDSKVLAAGFGYSSGTIRLWDADSGEPRGQLTNHTGWVCALAFNPDGQRLASASTDQTIRIWSVADQAYLGRLQGHKDEVWALSFLPDGRTLVSGCKDGSVCFWDILAGSQALPPTKIVVSPDSLTHSTPVVNRFGIAFTPDSRSFITTDRDGSLGIWDAQSVQLTERLPALGTNNWGVALSPDGHWLAAGDTSGKVHIWDWRARQRVVTLEVPFEWCGFLRFSRSGHCLSARLLFNDDTVKVRMWRTGGWQEVPLAPAQQTGIRSVDLSPDDRRLAAGYADGSVKLWSFPAGQYEATCGQHKGSVFGVRFSEDGRVLASASEDGTVTLWDVVARRGAAPLRAHAGWAWSVAFSSDGRRLLTGGTYTKDGVKLWDVATHRELLTLSGEGQFFFDVAFSPDGNTLVATSLSGIAHFWRAPSWAEIEESERTGHP